MRSPFQLEFKDFEFIFKLGALSRYPLQSFVPNPGTKGFSLLSGLGELFSKRSVTYIYSIKNKTVKRRLCALVPSWQRRKKAKMWVIRYVVKFSGKNVLLCEVHKNGGS